MPEFFNSSLGLKLTVHEAVREVVRFMLAEPGRHYTVTVGTDSERLSNGSADFVTAIVVHRKGNGGRYFWRRVQEGKFHTLRDRIIREVFISLDFSKEVLSALQAEAKKAALPEWRFELHIDVGEGGPTKAMIQEVVGIVRASNFEAITKPLSYAASNIADRHV